jgi:hypothetical protein
MVEVRETMSQRLLASQDYGVLEVLLTGAAQNTRKYL